MPNKRDPNKIMLRLWLDREMLQEFKAYATAQGSNMSELLTAHILSLLQKTQL